MDPQSSETEMPSRGISDARVTGVTASSIWRPIDHAERTIEIHGRPWQGKAFAARRKMVSVGFHAAVDRRARLG